VYDESIYACCFSHLPEVFMKHVTATLFASALAIGLTFGPNTPPASASVIPFVQWGSDFNMRRLATSDLDSTPTAPSINLQFSQTGLNLGLGDPEINDSRHGITLGFNPPSNTTTNGNPYRAGLIDPEGLNLSTRTFYFLHEQLRADTTGDNGNRRIGPTSSYSTSLDWRSGGAEQYQMYLWHRNDFLASGSVSLSSPDSKLEVVIRSFNNIGTEGAVRFVIKNGDTWYYSQASRSATGTFTLVDPGSALWAAFDPEALSTTARALAMPASATFGAVNFDDIRFVGFASQTNPGTNLESRQGYDNFQFVAVPEPSSLALVGLVGMGLLARRRGA
jgi:hypothetical protein